MIEVVPVPSFNDNYIWLLRTNNSNTVAVVDPGDAEPVLEVLKQNKLKLAAILITHHHWDHVNGISQLLEHAAEALVYGPSNSPVNAITNRLKESDTFDLPGVLDQCSVIETPGHTLDHISYLIGNHLFCGDTLFSAGCGRLFEGSPQQMLASLNKLARLPINTNMYPAHEYTLANLQFADLADANNPAIAQRISQAKQLRQQNLPTVPSSLELELATNPFLRCETKGIKLSVEQHIKSKLSTPLDVFTELRLWKDNV